MKYLIFSFIYLVSVIVFGSQVDYPGWDINYTKSISSSLKASYCAQQITTCVIVCYTSDQPNPLTNTCESDVMAYNCICGDTVVPKLDIFTGTIIFFECQQVTSICQTNCAGTTNEQACKSGCLDKYVCPSVQPSAAARVPLNGTPVVATGNGNINERGALVLAFVLLIQ